MTEPKRVFVAWQDPNARNWHVVGRLTEYEDRFAFNYTKGALREDFIRFNGMDELNKTYISKDLFPLFKNRLLSHKRPEYPDFIHWLGLKKDKITPAEILGRSGGRRMTDQLQMFNKVDFSEDGSFEYFLFAHGLNYLTTSAKERISKLKNGEQLLFCIDCQNQYDKYAMIIRVDKPAEIVGYCPRYLAAHVLDCLKEDKDSIKVYVEALNEDAPSNYKLMCKIKGKLSKSLIDKFMNYEEFKEIN